jgi:soluble cytochrome b562
MKTVNQAKVANLQTEIASRKEKLASSQKLSGAVVLILAIVSFFSIFLGSGYIFDSIWVRLVLSAVGMLVVYFLNNTLVKMGKAKLAFVIMSVILTLVLSSTFAFFFIASNPALFAEAQEELRNYRQVIDQHNRLVELSDKAVQLLKTGEKEYAFNANEENKGAFSGSKSSTAGSMNFLESRLKGISFKFGDQALTFESKMKESKRAVEESEGILLEAEKKLTQKPSGSAELKKYMTGFENSLLSLDQSVRNFHNPNEEIQMIISGLEGYITTELNVQPSGTGDLAQNQRNAMEKVKSGLQNYIENLKKISNDLTRAENDIVGIKLYSQENFNPMVACFNHIDVTWIWLLIAILFDIFPYIVVFIHFNHQKEIDELQKELELELQDSQTDKS